MATEDTNDNRNKIRDYLRKVAEERAALPENQRVTIPNPSKYSLPIGIDANGKPLGLPPTKDGCQN